MDTQSFENDRTSPSLNVTQLEQPRRAFKLPKFGEIVNGTRSVITERAGLNKFNINKHIHPEKMTNIFDADKPKFNNPFADAYNNKTAYAKQYGLDLDGDYNFDLQEIQKWQQNFKRPEWTKKKSLDDMNIVEQNLYLATQMSGWIVQDVFSNLKAPWKKSDQSLEERYSSIVQRQRESRARYESKMKELQE